MKEFAIVSTVAHLPPARDMLSLTALRLFLGDDGYTSLLFPDSPAAASIQVGDWVSYERISNPRTPTLGFKLSYLSARSNLLAHLESHFPTEVSRLLALRKFFDKQDLRQRPDERELADIDHRLQKLRASFNTTCLPMDLFITAMPAEFRSREMMHEVHGAY